MPKLVLLPGMDGSGNLFEDFIAALPDGFDVVAVRYSAEQYSYSELVKVVQAECRNPDPFVLLAESYSSPLAVHYAATHPPNLKGLILCAGFVSSPVQGLRRFLCLVFSPLLFCCGLPEFAARRWLVGANAPHSSVAKVRGAVASMSPRVLAGRLRAVLTCDARSELRRIGVPILYIQATEDRLVNASCLAQIQQIQPGVDTAVIEGPHLLLQRNPGPAARVIAGFSGRL